MKAEYSRLKGYIEQSGKTIAVTGAVMYQNTAQKKCPDTLYQSELS